MPVAGFAADGTINFTGDFIPTTCSVSTKDVSASFGTRLPLNTFGAAGTVSGWGPDFTISLDCAGSSSSVYMVLSDATTSGNRTSTLTLTSTSTASGMGIEIWKSNSGTQYSFGPDSAAANTTNQFLAYTANGNASQKVNLVFSWRYVRTSAVLRAGSANGKATFTMSYQ